MYKIFKIEDYIFSIKILFLVSLFFLPITAFAAFDVTGSWTGSSLAGGNTYANSFTIQQQGTVITGTQIAGVNQTCFLTGTITGNAISFHTECPTISYSSDASGFTDGTNMTGTFLDSQGTSGTFEAQKISVPVLTPDTKLTESPVVQVKAQTATFILKKFTQISLSKLRSISIRAKAQKLTLDYELTIAGAEKRKITSKKNVLTAKNLKPGNYSSSYKITAYKDNKKAYSTKASPTARFSIVKNN